MNRRYLDKDIYNAVNKMSNCKVKEKLTSVVIQSSNGLRWCYATTITYILSMNSGCHNVPHNA